MTCDQCGSRCQGKFCRECGRAEHQDGRGEDVSYGWALEEKSGDDEDDVKACPNCDSTEWSPRSQTDHDYYCKNCGHTFDDLHVRGPKGTNRGPKPETMLKRYANTEASD